MLKSRNITLWVTSQFAPIRVRQAPRASYCNEIKSQGPQGLKTDKMLWQLSITEFVFYAMNVISHLPIAFRIILTSKFKSILARFCPAEDTDCESFLITFSEVALWSKRILHIFKYYISQER